MSLRDLEKDAVLMGRRWLRGLLFADWGLKVLALLITFGLWFAVTSQRTPTVLPLRRAPLVVIPPSDMEVSNDLREEVDVTLRGSQHSLATLKAGDVVLKYDASTLAPGTHTLRLTPQNIRLELPEGLYAEGVQIDRIEPSTVKLQLERRIEREFVVSVPIEGQLPAGYELLGVQSVPNRIRVRGPESHVNELQKVQTESVSIAGQTNSFTAQQVAVDISDPKLIPLETAVDVQFHIDEVRGERLLPGVVVQVAAGPGAAQPGVATLHLRGPRSAIEALHAADVKLLLEPTAEGTLQLRLQLPPDLAGRVELLATTPAEFTIRK